MTNPGDNKLFLFFQFDELIDDFFVISGIQSFEMMLLSVMHTRPVSALISGSTAVETILRSEYTRGADFSNLIDLASQDGKISQNLSEKAHELRKLRNEFIHGGSSPKDNPRAIKAVLTIAVPLFRTLINNIANIDLNASFMNLGLSRVLEKSRLIAAKVILEEDVPYAVLVRTLANTCITDFLPSWLTEQASETYQTSGQEFQMPENHDALATESWMKIFQQIEKNGLVFYSNGNAYQTSVGSDSDEFKVEVGCPAYPCRGVLTLGFVKESRNIESSLIAAHCPYCSLYINDVLSIKYFVFAVVDGDILERVSSALGYELDELDTVLHSMEALTERSSYPFDDGSITPNQLGNMRQAAAEVKSIAKKIKKERNDRKS